MDQNEVLYNVVCTSCGQVWTPAIRSPLWWKAKKRSEEGFLDAYPATPRECGCQKPVFYPDAPYRVVGYDDLCSKFDMPFKSLVAAARTYLRMSRDGMYVVHFVEKRTERKPFSRMQVRLEQMALREKPERATV